MQQTTKLNIVAIDDQEDHKVGKLEKNNWVSWTEKYAALLQGLADKKYFTTTTSNGSS